LTEKDSLRLLHRGKLHNKLLYILPRKIDSEVTGILGAAENQSDREVFFIRLNRVMGFPKRRTT